MEDSINSENILFLKPYCQVYLGADYVMMGIRSPMQALLKVKSALSQSFIGPLLQKLSGKGKPLEQRSPFQQAVQRYFLKLQSHPTQRLIQEKGGKLEVVETPLGCRFLVDMENLIDRTIYINGIWEPKTTALLKQLVKPGMVIFDIGANVGYFSVLFSHWTGPGGRVVAVEPMTRAFWKLKAQHALNMPEFCHDNVVFLHQGLSDAIGMMECGFEHQFKPDSAEKKPEKEMVRFSTMDQTVSEMELSRLDLIKLDVDGFEEKVILGATDVLKQFKPLIVLEFSNLIQGIEGLFNQLKSLGYNLFHVETMSEIPNIQKLQELLKESPHGYFEALAQSATVK